MPKAKQKKLEPGIYGAMIEKAIANKDGSVEVTMTIQGKGFKVREHYSSPGPSKNTNPDAGAIRFFVLCERLSIYTSIGADNIHHASNKCTKLFGPNWSQITQDAYLLRGYKHVIVGVFTALIKTLPN